MGDQTDSQVSSQVAKSRKFHTYTDDLRSTCVDLRSVVKRGKTFRILPKYSDLLRILSIFFELLYILKCFELLRCASHSYQMF